MHTEHRSTLTEPEDSLTMATSTDQSTAFDDAVAQLLDGAGIADQMELLLAQLTLDEKLWLLDGDAEFWAGIAEMSAGYNLRPIVMGEIPRLGIPGLRFSDGPR